MCFRRPTPIPRPDRLVRVGALVRKVAAAVRYWPDRGLHPFRRARARRHVKRSAPVRSVLFICHGNICRSPFAAAVLADAARVRALDISVSSAGFVGPQRRPPEAALRASERRDIDLSAHTSVLIDSKSLMAADVVCVMEAQQASRLKARFGHRGVNILVLGDLDPLPVSRRTITDPWGASDHVFDASYDRIERCVQELVQLFAALASRVDPRG